MSKLSKLRKALVTFLAVMLVSVFSAALLGCSGNAQQSSEGNNVGFDVQEIQVTKSGFTMTDDGNVRFAFVAKNPNEGHLAKDVVFTIEGYDTNGSMVVGGGETLTRMYPDSEVAAAGTLEVFDAEEEVTELSSLIVKPMMEAVSWEDTTLTGADIKNDYNIENASLENVDGLLDISAGIGVGESAGDNASILENVYTVALLENANGEVLCGSDPKNFTIDTESELYTFETEIQNPPEYANCILYVTPY